VTILRWAQSLEGSRPTDLGGASWVAASATPDMSSEDPALQPPVLEPWRDGDGEGRPHPGMFETNRSATQSRRNASNLMTYPKYVQKCSKILGSGSLRRTHE